MSAYDDALNLVNRAASVTGAARLHASTVVVDLLYVHDPLDVLAALEQIEVDHPHLAEVAVDVRDLLGVD